MADVTGVATSYDLPNYIGELFQKGERPNAFVRLFGGLAGAIRLVGAPEFAMGVDYSLSAPTQPAILEGADPVFKEEDTNQSSNITQVFQEGVKLTYSLESRNDAIGGIAVIPGKGNGDLQNPNSMAWQVARAVERVQNAYNYSALRGAYQKPANNATARKMRGVRTSVTTNLFANAGTPRANSKVIFEAALKNMMVNGAFALGAEVYAFGDANQIENLVNLYKADGNQPIARDIVGVAIRTIVTTWATVHLVWEPDMAAGELFITQPSRVRPTAMPIIAGGISKGVLFVEELAKTGAATPMHVYGELGVDYTHEVFHGVLADLTP